MRDSVTSLWDSDALVARRPTVVVAVAVVAVTDDDGRPDDVLPPLYNQQISFKNEISLPN